MGTCGCSDSGNVFKLPGPKGMSYLIKLLPACDYCDVGPTIHILRISKKCNKSCKEEIKCAEELPISWYCNDIPLTSIVAGASRSELKEFARSLANEEINEVVMETIADELYDVLPQTQIICEGA